MTSTRQAQPADDQHVVDRMDHLLSEECLNDPYQRSDEDAAAFERMTRALEDGRDLYADDPYDD